MLERLNPEYQAKGVAPAWRQVLGSVLVGTDATFSAAGISEVCVMATLGTNTLNWFQITIPIGFIYRNTRYFNFGTRDWAIAFHATKPDNSDTVTCKLLCDSSTTVRMWVLVH